MSLSHSCTGPSLSRGQLTKPLQIDSSLSGLEICGGRGRAEPLGLGGKDLVGNGRTDLVGLGRALAGLLGLGRGEPFGLGHIVPLGRRGAELLGADLNLVGAGPVGFTAIGDAAVTLNNAARSRIEQEESFIVYKWVE